MARCSLHNINQIESCVKKLYVFVPVNQDMKALVLGSNEDEELKKKNQTSLKRILMGRREERK